MLRLWFRPLLCDFFTKELTLQPRCRPLAFPVAVHFSPFIPERQRQTKERLADAIYGVSTKENYSCRRVIWLIILSDACAEKLEKTLDEDLRRPLQAFRSCLEKGQDGAEAAAEEAQAQEEGQG